MERPIREKPRLATGAAPRRAPQQDLLPLTRRPRVQDGCLCMEWAPGVQVAKKRGGGLAPASSHRLGPRGQGYRSKPDWDCPTKTCSFARRHPGPARARRLFRSRCSQSSMLLTPGSVHPTCSSITVPPPQNASFPVSLDSDRPLPTRPQLPPCVPGLRPPPVLQAWPSSVTRAGTSLGALQTPEGHQRLAATAIHSNGLSSYRPSVCPSGRVRSCS